MASNVDVGHLQRFFLPDTLKGAEEHSEVRPHWTHLLVDEAAQGTEPDLSPALATVMPHPTCKEALSVVLIGDAAQLVPSIRSSYARSHSLDISLYERLSKLPVYAEALKTLKQQGRATVLNGDYR